MKETKKRVRFSNAYDFDKTKDSNFEKVEGESLTVPDQNLSLKQMVERYTRTGTLPAGVKEKQVFYDADDPLPDLAMMSKQERIEFVNRVDGLIKTKRSELLKKQNDLKKAAKELESEVEKKEESEE